MACTLGVCVCEQHQSLASGPTAAGVLKANNLLSFKPQHCSHLPSRLWAFKQQPGLKCDSGVHRLSEKQKTLHEETGVTQNSKTQTRGNSNVQM